MIASACVVHSPLGGAADHLQSPVLNELRADSPGVVDWHDLIGVSMDHKSRDADSFQILSLISLRECLYAVVCDDDGDHHPLQPEGFTDAVGDSRSRSVVTIKRKSQILEELRAVVDDVSAEIVKNRQGQATRIPLRS